MSEIDAFILIGGRSSRFGRNKATVLFDGTPMTERIAASINDAIDGIRIRLVAANERQLLEFGDLESLDGFVFDLYQARGPAGGLHAALSNSEKDWAFVAACDIPLISTDLIRILLGKIGENVDAVVPVQPDGRLQPLAAFYRTKIVCDRLSALLERPRPAPAMNELLDGLRVTRVDFAEIKDLTGAQTIFTNVNSQEDLVEAEMQQEKDPSNA